MTKNEELSRLRISKRGINADDINHPGRLSDDEIANLPISTVYNWVRVGAWKPKQFNMWLKVMRVVEWANLKPIAPRANTMRKVFCTDIRGQHVPKIGRTNKTEFFAKKLRTEFFGESWKIGVEITSQNRKTKLWLLLWLAPLIVLISILVRRERLLGSPPRLFVIMRVLCMKSACPVGLFVSTNRTSFLPRKINYEKDSTHSTHCRIDYACFGCCHCSNGCCAFSG